VQIATQLNPVDHCRRWALGRRARGVGAYWRGGGLDVIFAGYIGEAQDFPVAADILKPHPNVRWLIAGDGRMAK
jgi:hypothetical protein